MLKCQRCAVEIPPGESYEHYGQILCEDCYIGAIQPPKPCDVAAVHGARVIRALTGQRGTEGLTPRQRDIYNYIKEQGKATKRELMDRFNLPEWELDKEIAILRHCELTRAKKEGNTIFIVPFES